MTARLRCCVLGAVLAAECAEGRRPKVESPAGPLAFCVGDVWRGPAFVVGPEEITAVEPLYGRHSSDGWMQSRLRGAILYIKPVAGLRRDVLESMILCHRLAIAHGLVPARAADIYALDFDRLKVSVENDEGGGLIVELASDNVDDARGVLLDAYLSACPRSQL